MRIAGIICYVLAALLWIGAAFVVFFWALIAPQHAALFGLLFASFPSLAGVGLWLLGKILRKAGKIHSDNALTGLGKGMVWIGLVLVGLVVVVVSHSFVSVTVFDQRHVMTPLQTAAVHLGSALVYMIPGLSLVFLGFCFRARPVH